MSLDSYAFAVPKGTDLNTVKELWENDDYPSLELLHHWDNDYHLHASMERLWEMHTYGEFKLDEELYEENPDIIQGIRMKEFTEQFFKLHINDLIALKRWYEIMHYDEIEDVKGDIDFFKFGKLLYELGNVDIYYVSSI